MESAVWGQDWSWLADDLIARIAAAAAMEPVILPARLIDSPRALSVLEADTAVAGEAADRIHLRRTG